MRSLPVSGQEHPKSLLTLWQGAPKEDLCLYLSSCGASTLDTVRVRQNGPYKQVTFRTTQH